MPEMHSVFKKTLSFFSLQTNCSLLYSLDSGTREYVYTNFVYKTDHFSQTFRLDLDAILTALHTVPALTAHILLLYISIITYSK